MASKWDGTVASAVIRGTSPTAQVPKLFGPIYATASMESGSGTRVPRIGDQRPAPPEERLAGCPSKKNLAYGVPAKCSRSRREKWSTVLIGR